MFNEYFYFFPVHNIFFFTNTSMLPGPKLGYYHFEKSAIDSNVYLYLKGWYLSNGNLATVANLTAI